MRSSYLLPLLLILPAAAHPPTEPDIEALVVTGKTEGSVEGE